MQVLVELEAGRDSTATDLTGDAGIVGRFFRAGEKHSLNSLIMSFKADPLCMFLLRVAKLFLKSCRDLLW